MKSGTFYLQNVPTLLGSDEKHRRYVEKRYVICIKSLVFFGTLTYLLWYVRVFRVPNIPEGRYKVYRDVKVYRDIRDVKVY